MRRSAIIVLLPAALMALGVGFWLGRVQPEPTPAAHPAPVAATKPEPPRDSWSIIAARSAGTTPDRAVKPSPTASLPLGPFSTNIDELKRRADKGDANAAKALADGYRRCRFFKPPKTQADLERRAEDRTVAGLNLVDQLVDKAKVAAREQNIDIGELPEVDAVAAYREELKAQTDLAAECHGIDAVDAREWFAWYERAAELGDPDAQVGYWDVAFQASLDVLDEIPRRKEIAVAALQRSLSSGDWRALIAIGTVLGKGYLAEPDPAQAYAWYYAASLAPTEDITVLPWVGDSLLVRLATGNDTQTHVAALLTRTAPALDAVQIADAERIGADLFARCCGGRR